MARTPTRPLVPRELGWIDDAPIAVRGEAITSASPEAVFSVLADHERWPEWFPNVKAVEVLGPAEGIGARRRVRVPALVVDEEFIAWEPGVRWAFTGTHARPGGIVQSLVEDCRLEVADGQTHVTYTMYLDPRPGRGALVRAARPTIRRTLTRAVRQLGLRAGGS